MGAGFLGLTSLESVFFEIGIIASIGTCLIDGVYSWQSSLPQKAF